MRTLVRLGDALAEVKAGIGTDWAKFPVYGATVNGIAPAKEPPGKNAQKYKPIMPGTIFYNPMRILIGSIAYADESMPQGITSPDYVVFRGKPNKINSLYFYYWLRSPKGQNCILSLARGAVRERMLFSRLAEAEVFLPEFEMQEETAKKLKLVNDIRSALQSQMDEVDDLSHRIIVSSCEVDT